MKIKTNIKKNKPAAKSLANPKFRPKVADTDKKKKDPKKARRKWKNKGEC